MAAIVLALRGDTPVIHATSAGTESAPVAPQSSSWSISATMSTICPSIALRWPVSSATLSNNTSRRSDGLTSGAKEAAGEDMTPSNQRGLTNFWLSAPSPPYGLKRVVELPEPFGQAQVLRVVDGARDDRHTVVREGRAQYGQEFIGGGDSVSLGTEALGILHHVGIGEPDVVMITEFEVHLPFDQAVPAVLPDQHHQG